MPKSRVLDLLARASMGISKLPPASIEEVAESEKEMGRPIPDDLKDFYLTVSNGLVFGRIRILPVKSKGNLKKTADSIARHNDKKYSTWFNGDENTLSEFLVFAVEESHSCFSYSKGGDFIWYWSIDKDEVVELDFQFYDCLEETLMQEGEFLRFRAP